MPGTLPDRVHLGAFELDVRAGELRKGKRTIRLQEKPLRILQLLAEGRGDVVTRDELQRKLWPNDTVVDFEHSINTAIKKLRQALDDSPDEPRYIETIPRRGYRLLVPVEPVGPAEDDSSASNEPDPNPQERIEPGASAQKEAESSVLIGRKVSHYRVLEVIGGGGMGLVYKAEDLKLGRQVALKFLPEELGSDPKALERFEREARAASALDHPNICAVYEFGEHDGQPFIVMQLLEGQTLRDRLSAGEGALPLEELLDIGIQVSDGLRAAHERGIIHRDIKPANIFITNKGVCKILDFGVAKLLELGEDEDLAAQPGALSVKLPAATGALTLTRTGSAMGTAGYMSPEQARGEKLDARTDLFSLGLVLYEVATGQRAFSGETAEAVRDAIVHHTQLPIHDLNSKLPPELETIIDKALEKDRELRYRSAVEMRVDLQTINPETGAVIAEPRVLHWKVVAAVAVVILCAVIAGGVYRYSHRAAKLTEKDTIIIADFENSTRDPVFDDGLGMALGMYLNQSPFFSRLSGRKLNAALKLLNYTPPKSRFDEHLPVALAREVCLRTNSKAMLTGTIADVGNRYRVEIRAVNCQTGATMAISAAEADNRDRVMAALGQAGAKLREELGEPSALRKRFNTPPEQALTSSPEALQAYMQGNEANGLQHDIAYLNRATELDPEFAEAFHYLGIDYNNLGSDALAARCWKKGYELRARLTPRRRLLAEGTYYFAVTGELEKYIETQKQTVKDYPVPMDGEYPHYALSMTYYSLGQHDQALAEAREQVRTEPDNFWSYLALLRVYCALNRLNEAQSTFDTAGARRMDSAELHVSRYVLAFAKGDNKGMEEQVAWAKGKPGENRLLSAASDTEAYYGRFTHAREFTRQAVDSAQKGGETEAAAAWEGQGALREAEVGNVSQAQHMAAQSLSLADPYDLKALAALTLSAAADSVEAQKLADHIDHERPLDTLVQYYWLPVIRAQIQMTALKPEEGLQGLTITSPYDLGSPGFKQEPFANLYPVYVRGKAYLQAGHGQQAAAEFQKIVDHRGLVSNFIIGALAHLQLGRAQVMMGDKDAARKSYQEFLTLWKDADPDVPIYKQAKLEYAKIH